MATTDRKRSLTIGVLAGRSGVGVETIRFYERKGLIDQPKRPLGGVRVYPEQAIERIEFVHHAQELGFTLREIRDLLTLQSHPETNCRAVQARALGKLAEIETKLAELLHTRSTLRKLVVLCPGEGELDECVIVEALSAKTPSVSAKSRRKSSKRNVPMKSADLHIEGMHCQGCAKTIEALLTSETGIKSATASFAEHRATVYYDPELIDLAQIASAVERAGYRVTPSK